MSVELYDQDEIIAFGNPWHGSMEFNGTLTLPNGSSMAGVGEQNGDHCLVEFAGLMEPTTSAPEVAAGMAWRSYSILQGRGRRYSPKGNLGFGIAAWLYRTDDGVVYALRFVDQAPTFKVEIRKVSSGPDWSVAATLTKDIPGGFSATYMPPVPLRTTHSKTGDISIACVYRRRENITSNIDATTYHVTRDVDLVLALRSVVSGGSGSTLPNVALTVEREPASTDYFRTLTTTDNGDSGVPIQASIPLNDAWGGVVVNQHNTTETRRLIIGIVVTPDGDVADCVAEEITATVNELLVPPIVPPDPETNYGPWSFKRTVTTSYNVKIGLSNLAVGTSKTESVDTFNNSSMTYSSSPVVVSNTMKPSSPTVNVRYRMDTCHVATALVAIGPFTSGAYDGYAIAPDGGALLTGNRFDPEWVGWNPKSGQLLRNGRWF